KGLKQIIKTVDRMADIIASIRQITRTDNNIKIKPVDLKFLIDESINMCANFLSNDSVQVKFINPIPQIHVNPVEISQVLVNLLKNAHDAISEQDKKQIQILTSFKNQKVIVEVTDNGPGISESVKEHIMEPFYTTKPIGQGTGLGLSISKSLCERNKARLYLADKREETTFIVEFTDFKTNKTQREVIV
ncbi:MAG: HAMP domain-containing histidine kinase, partial [Bdellovibrionales bacterium]|nr:HAMP domain-containing histidine kinase [Bdellovibrionales bacterium]